MMTWRKPRARAVSVPGRSCSQCFALFARSIRRGSMTMISVPSLICFRSMLQISPSSLVEVMLLPQRTTSLLG